MSSSISSSSSSSLVLGVYDGTHDAGAVLLQDGVLVAGCNEERFSRVKCSGGWPEASIRQCMAIAGARPQDLAEVAVAGFINPNPGLRIVRPMQRRWRLDDGWFYNAKAGPRALVSNWLQFDSPFPRLRSEGQTARVLQPLLQARLLREIRHTLDHRLDCPVRIYDHHDCHAAGAWYSSGWDRGLLVVSDGIGDGLALTVYHGEGPRLRRICEMPYPHSYGLLYAVLTGFLGFRPFRHEGKVTGLAARGDAEAVDVPFPFAGPPDRRTYTGGFGRAAVPLLQALGRHSREDVCAWLQKGLEDDLLPLVATFAERVGVDRISLAGGVFANVRLNQRIAELPGVATLNVFPHMGDGGLAAGAAWMAWARQEGDAALPRALPDVFLGPSFPEAEQRQALERAALRVERPADLAGALASHLAEGRVVARFDGAMEYGPRALGNRSILASAADLAINDRLNGALARSEFMPFAPSILAEEADLWMDGLERVPQAARFMTVTVPARQPMVDRCEAVVHLDGTLRPQLVDSGRTPGFHGILAAYHRITGVPALINTSFNLHEEPIVCTPDEAIASFLRARLDVLAMGPFLARAG